MQFAVEKVGREIVFFLHVVGDSVSIPCRPHRHCAAACACGRGNPAPPLSFYITRLLLVVPSLSWQHKEHFFDFEKTVSKKKAFFVFRTEEIFVRVMCAEILKDGLRDV